MTEAGWTRGKCVAVPGWYWWREGPGEKHKMVRITKGYKALRVEVPLHNSWMFGAVDGFGGEFKGPITPDSYQHGRAAGLVRGAQLVRWHKSCAFEADPALALERAAKDIESVASQIIQPQQAQAEGGGG